MIVMTATRRSSPPPGRPDASISLPRAATVDRHGVVVTSLEHYSKARPGRRARRFPWLHRVVSPLVAAALLAAPVLALVRPAAADQLANAQAQAAQLASQIQAQAEQLAVLSERYDEDQIHVQQLDQQVTQTEAQITLTMTQVTTAQSDLRQLVVQDYTSGGSQAGLEQLFTPGGERSAAVQEYQQVASESVSGAIDRLHKSESVLSAQESQLQTTQSQAQTTL